MTTKTEVKHTPTPKRKSVMNEYACGCKVFSDNAGGYFIEYCKRHMSIGELREQNDKFKATSETLLEAAKRLHAEGHHQCLGEACYMEKAIAQAESK